MNEGDTVDTTREGRCSPPSNGASSLVEVPWPAPDVADLPDVATVEEAVLPVDAGTGKGRGSQPLSDELATAGAVLRERRLAKGVGLRELAGMAGISAGYLSHVEKGQSYPPARETLLQMEFLLGEEPYALARIFRKLPDGPCLRCAGLMVSDILSPAAVALGEEPDGLAHLDEGAAYLRGRKAVAQEVLGKLLTLRGMSDTQRLIQSCRAILAEEGNDAPNL